MPTNLANVLTDRHSANSVFPRRNELGGWAVPASEWWLAGSEHMGSIPPLSFQITCFLCTSVFCEQLFSLSAGLDVQGCWGNISGLCLWLTAEQEDTIQRVVGISKHYHSWSSVTIRVHKVHWEPSIIQFLLLDSHGGALPARTGQWDNEKTHVITVYTILCSFYFLIVISTDRERQTRPTTVLFFFFTSHIVEKPKRFRSLINLVAMRLNDVFYPVVVHRLLCPP